MSQHCWAQHVACVWPPCCNMLAVVGSSLKLVKFEPTTPNTPQHVATRWPNARKMLRPTMLWHVAIVWPGLKDLINPWPEWIHWFLWCTMIQNDIGSVILIQATQEECTPTLICIFMSWLYTNKAFSKWSFQLPLTFVVHINFYRFWVGI